jgi:hypothetical protein
VAVKVGLSRRHVVAMARALGSVRGAAALLAVFAVGLIPLAVPVLEWGGGGRQCRSLVETGVPCVGCGGTRALERALAGDVWGAMLMNVFGAFAGVTLWALLLASALSLATGWPRFLKWFVVVFGLGAPAAFGVEVVLWWLTWFSVLARAA